MGRSAPFFPTVIACACAVQLLCAPAIAQSPNDDRYGFVPMPAPNMPMQMRLTPPPISSSAPAQPAPVQNSAPNYAPPVPSFSQAFVPPQAQPPPPGYSAASSRAAYGYVTAPPNQREYYAPGPGINSGYILGPGDKLHVSVFGEDDLSGEYQIDGSGLVRLPLIGTLRAAGYTAPILENTIAGALAQGYLKSPRVNVEIATYRPFYIIGAVNRPGEYPYVDNMSALNAVAFGGGFTDQAKESTVYVRHEGSTVEEAVPASQATRVWPGDVIRVKDTLFWDAMSIFSPIAGPAALAAAAIH